MSASDSRRLLFLIDPENGHVTVHSRGLMFADHFKNAGWHVEFLNVRETPKCSPMLTLRTDRLLVEFVASRLRCGFRPKFPEIRGRLLAQAKTFNNIAVPIRVAAVEIVQQSPAFVHHHNQSAT